MNKGQKYLILDDCKRSCTDTNMFSVFLNQTILITGGTGFIGKWISEIISFINDSERINIKIILLARDIEKFKQEVPHLADKPFISFINQDIRNIKDLPKEITFIINAAGSPDNKDHVSQPIKTLDTFYRGTQTLLDAATRLPDLRKIIHLSSHQVYGHNDSEVSLNEQFTGKLNFYNVYAESKRVAECICYAYRKEFKLPILILRPFALIGPYQGLEKPWAINNFIRDEILGGPIRIFGNELTTRSYLYASDMAYWILKALANGSVGEAYNLGSSRAINLIELAGLIQHLGGNNVEIIYKPSKDDYTNTSKIIPDNKKIVNQIGVKETLTLEEAIKKTLLWNKLNKAEETL